MKEDFFELGETNFTPEQIAEMMNPALAKKKADERKFQDFVTQVFDGDTEDNAGQYKLRFIVERDSWFVAVKSDGRFATVNAQPGEYMRLIAGISKVDGRRTDRVGQGGQFIVVYRVKPEDERMYAVYDGRRLVRALPTDVSGMLLQLEEDDQLRELTGDYCASLLTLVDAIELEDTLIEGGFSDVASIKSGKFLAATYKNNLWLTDCVATIATHEDRIYIDNKEVSLKPYSGETILKMVLEHPDFCGVVINSSCEISRKGEGDDVRGLLLSLNCISRALKEDRCLVRVPKYVVRSREEFDLWLDQVQFPKPREVIEEKDVNGKTFVHAVCRQNSAEWSIYESVRCKVANMVATPKFELTHNSGTSDEVGQGQSPVLCPGLLVRSLYYQLPPDRDRQENRWAPGKSLVVARLLSEEDIAKSKLRVRLANEILKLIPQGADTVPRESMLSVEGARFLSRAELGSLRDWVQSALDQARRYNRKLVFRT